MAARGIDRQQRFLEGDDFWCKLSADGAVSHILASTMRSRSMSHAPSQTSTNEDTVAVATGPACIRHRTTEHKLQMTGISIGSKSAQVTGKGRRACGGRWWELRGSRSWTGLHEHACRG